MPCRPHRMIRAMPYHTVASIRPARRLEHYDYAILNLARKARELEERGLEVHPLHIGDPTLFGFRPPEPLARACVEALNRTGYAPAAGLAEAREAITAEAASRGIATSPDTVLLTAGATEAADLLFTALLNPGDEVLLPAPGYPLYPALASRQEAVAVPYRLYGSAGWQPDLDELEALFTPATRLLVVVNPGNPTGELWPASLLDRLVAIALRHGVPILVDEVYSRIIHEGRHVPLASLAGSELPVFTLESMSKNFMVPGWRCGWLTMTNPAPLTELRRALGKLADARLAAPAAPQHALPTALSLDRSYLAPVLDRLGRQREAAQRGIEAIEGLSANAPAGAFYLMAQADLSRLPYRTDREFCLALLEESGVFVVPGSGFGCDPADGYFRIVYLPETAELEAHFGRIAHFFDQTFPSLTTTNKPSLS